MPGTILRRETLYEEVWRLSILGAAERYGITDVGLAKICRKLGVPVPKRGYRSRLKAGRAEIPPPLPKATPGMPTEHLLLRRDLLKLQGQTSEKAARLVKRERRSRGQVSVVSTLRWPHPLLAPSIPVLREASRLRKPIPGLVHVVAEGPALQRALRIMNAIFKALTASGFRVELRDFPLGAGVWILDQFIQFGIREELQRFQFARTSADEELPGFSFRGTGRLRLTIYVDPWFCWRRRWRDTDRRPLESVLKSFIRGLIIAADTKSQEWLAKE